MRYYVTLEGKEYTVDVTPDASGTLAVAFDGEPVDADIVGVGSTLSLRLDGRVIDLTTEGEPPELGVIASGRRVYLRVESERLRAASAARKGGSGPAGDHYVTSPMPGRVVKILVSVGDAIEPGTALVVVEAMKMENELRATRAGTIAAVFVAAGATVESGARLLQIA